VKSKIIYDDIARDLCPVLDHVTSSGLITDGILFHIVCGLFSVVTEVGEICGLLNLY